MKKALSLVVALVLMTAMCIPAFAAGDSQTVDASNPASINVNATLDYSPDHGGDVISVEVQWTDMTFTYTQKQDKIWNTEKHDYDFVDKDAGSGWNKTGATITVTNHSNVKIKADLAYTPEANSPVTGAFDQSTLTLNSAEGTTVANAPAASSNFEIGGKPTTVGTNKIGTITVSIAKVTA